MEGRRVAGDIELLRELCLAPATVRVRGAGAGGGAAAPRVRSVRPPATRSATCGSASGPDDGPQVVVTAHADQIGLIVTFVDEHGYLGVDKIGGVGRPARAGARVRRARVARPGARRGGPRPHAPHQGGRARQDSAAARAVPRHRRVHPGAGAGAGGRGRPGHVRPGLRGALAGRGRHAGARRPRRRVRGGPRPRAVRRRARRGAADGALHRHGGDHVHGRQGGRAAAGARRVRRRGRGLLQRHAGGGRQAARRRGASGRRSGARARRRQSSRAARARARHGGAGGSAGAGEGGAGGHVHGRRRAHGRRRGGDAVAQPAGALHALAVRGRAPGRPGGGRAARGRSDAAPGRPGRRRRSRGGPHEDCSSPSTSRASAGWSPRPTRSAAGRPAEQARRHMRADLDAVLAGCLAAGAARGRGVRRARPRSQPGPGRACPDEVVLVGGSPTPDSMLQGLGPGFDGALFVGYHARAGTAGAVLEHTWNYRVFSAARGRPRDRRVRARRPGRRSPRRAGRCTSPATTRPPPRRRPSCRAS